jgi:hypothetical protein
VGGAIESHPEYEETWSVRPDERHDRHVSVATGTGR